MIATVFRPMNGGFAPLTIRGVEVRVVNTVIHFEQ